MIASWKESYKNHRQHVKNKDIALPTKVHTVKAMVFPLIIYGYESWATKKT